MATKQLLSIDELSKQLGLTRNTLYSWVSTKKIPYVKLGRLVKFDPQDIDEWLIDKKVGMQKPGE